MRHFIFAYGSLAHKQVADITAETLSFQPAYLVGYARNFRVLIKTSQFAAAGIEERRENRMLGMLVEVPEGSLLKFDERESMYDRIEVDPERVHLVTGDEIPTGGFLYLHATESSVSDG